MAASVNALPRSLLVKLVEGDLRFRDLEMFEQQARLARILAGNEIDLAQNLQGA